MTSPQPILVLGATGKTGRRVAERLKAQGLVVRAGSRSGQPRFFWEDRDTWRPVLAGVQSVYITYQPDLAVPGAVETIHAFTQQAVASDVQRLVLLSGRGEPEAEACEQVVQQAGVEWTIVRASWFNQNFSEAFLLDSILNDEVVLPVGDTLEPFIDVEDVADVVAAALTESHHHAQIYEVTGPRLMTFAEAVEAIAQVSGRALRFVSVPPPAYVSMLEAAQVPEEDIWLTNYLFTTILDGRNSSVSDGVQRALGRMPRDFFDYAQETATSGVWNVPAVPSASVAKQR